jgi:FMN reductase
MAAPMAHVVLVSGSPTSPSKSSFLLQKVQQHLEGKGITCVNIWVRAFPAEDLIQGKWDSPAFNAAKQEIEQARGVVVATPVYKASYSGVLKTFLDILPQTAFRGKTLLPIMSGGSPGHLLAIDYALKPVLAALGATDVLQGVYTVDTQFTKSPDGTLAIADEILERLEKAAEHLAKNISIRTP